ncbi:hypothetical protein BJY04DRAFT_120181 [Aspergillus karnatakaensis]|uniref:uncharacterized protein n=1 Tax=Aspergillus karnatakaensis TaxID=1810916 RepID=UPI003CCD1494
MSKRATQNREAQRRFRERREQHNKSLQERGDLLQEKLDALEKRFGDQTEELVKLRGENEGLKKENLELARRWRIISRLLRTPKSSQVLSMFMTADDSSSGLDSDLDACLQCLDALVCPD